MQETVKLLIDMVLHLDRYLAEMSATLGGWTYVILFVVIFCETGLIITPFLPGDSLLFAVGALVAVKESQLNLTLMFILLLVAAVIGDAVNYAVGRKIGPRVFRSEQSRLLNRQHLLRAQKFYSKHGGKAIFLARFLPIVRTFAPFVAGVGHMNYARFWLFNVSGAICWVGLFLVGGYLFGNVPVVKRNFHLVILGIIFVSTLPVVIEWYRARRGGVEEDDPSEIPANPQQ